MKLLGKYNFQPCENITDKARFKTKQEGALTIINTAGITQDKKTI